MRATKMCDLSGWLEEGDWGKYGGSSKQGRTKVVGKRGEHSSYVTIPVTTLGHMISQHLYIDIGNILEVPSLEIYS